MAPDPAYKLLLVDDEPRVLRSLQAALRNQYSIITAKNGRDAQEKMGAHADIDAIVCDERMPVMRGHEFLAWAKENNPRSARILLTGNADLKALQISINEAEIFRYLAKPWSLEELRLTIDAAIQEAKVELSARLPSKTRRNILIVDAEGGSAEMIRRAVGDTHKTRAVRGAQALSDALVRDAAVLFVDTNIGVEECIKLVCRLRHDRPDLVQVVLTSAADGGSAIKMVNGGQIFRYLVKPLTPARLAPMLEAALARHALLHPDQEGRPKKTTTSLWKRLQQFPARWLS